MSEKRSSFTGKLGFVLAAAGSAVGLGNIWRFPYLAAQYGGAIFLLVYIALAITFGSTLLVAEIAIGRKTGLSAIGAYKKLDKRFAFIGWIGAIVPMIILPYYSVIGGWVIKYFAGYVSGASSDMANSTYFSSYISGAVEPLIWFGVFLLITSVAVILGVEKGVEKVSKFMMPLLVVEVKVKVFFVQEREYYEGYEYDDTTHKNCEQYLGQCGSVVADTDNSNTTCKTE